MRAIIRLKYTKRRPEFIVHEYYSTLSFEALMLSEWVQGVFFIAKKYANAQ
jgi:hypothetical protein